MRFQVLNDFGSCARIKKLHSAYPSEVNVSKTVPSARAHALFYDLVRPPQHRRRDRQPERLGHPAVDHELELGWLLHRKVCRLRAPEDLVHIDGSAPPEIVVVREVAHQTTGLHVGPSLEHRRQPVRNGQLAETLSRGEEEWGTEHENGLRAASG